MLRERQLTVPVPELAKALAAATLATGLVGTLGATLTVKRELPEGAPSAALGQFTERLGG